MSSADGLHGIDVGKPAASVYIHVHVCLICTRRTRVFLFWSSADSPVLIYSPRVGKPAASVYIYIYVHGAHVCPLPQCSSAWGCRYEGM